MNFFKKLWLFFVCRHGKCMIFEPDGVSQRGSYEKFGKYWKMNDVEIHMCVRCHRIFVKERVDKR